MCGDLTFKSQRQNFTPLIKKCYELYFGCKLGDQDKSCAPHICCVTSVRLLTGWKSGSYRMPFTIPLVWREPTDLSSDCYFCFTNITVITSKNKHTVKYPDLPSTVRPVTHIEELPVPKFLENLTFSSDSSDSDDDHGQQEGDNADGYPTFAASCSSFELHIFTQGDLNDLIHDLNLFKKQAEILGLIVKGWYFLHQDIEICFFHNRQNEFEEIFFFLKKMIWCFVMMCAS